MQLTVTRHQEQGRKGTTFRLHFQLALLPEEQQLVQRYGLYNFKVFTYSVNDLLRGVQYEGLAMGSSAQVNRWTEAVAKVNDAVKAEKEIRQGCSQLQVALHNLRGFTGTHEFLYDLTDEVGGAALS